jgi:hypothetical protein
MEKKHQKLTLGERNVVHNPLLSLVKNVVKAMKKDGPVFLYLQL